MKTQSKIGISAVEWIAMALVVVGAINWGLVGIAGFVGGNMNLVDLVFGSVPTIENAIYLLVGLAGLYLVYFGYQLYSAGADERTTMAEPKGTVK